jgi:hypothetical protein
MRALIEFSKEERLVGAACAHDSFDGILAEHALALEEIRDLIREGLRFDYQRFARPKSFDALEKLEEQITYVRALGSVAQKEEETDGAG